MKKNLLMEDEISPLGRNDINDSHFERNETKREICLSKKRFLLPVEMTNSNCHFERNEMKREIC